MPTVPQTAPAGNGQGVYKVLPIGGIRTSPLNPRQHFDQAELSELAESVASKGVLEPILVRPWPAGQPDPLAGGDAADPPAWEIAAGERRYRAACIAGLESVPAIVRKLSDRDLLEIAVIENDQRADLTPLERAAGYAALVGQHGVAIEDLAQRIGKSPTTVHLFLRLHRQLPEAAREALNRGDISSEVAGLIASRPSPAMREKVADYALNPDWRGTLPSSRDVKHWIGQTCMVELKQATFSRKALDLVEGAGSCDGCPKRTGNNREEYPDGRADICTDPPCFEAKTQAHAARLVEAAKAEGKTVLSKKESAQIFDKYRDGRLPYNSDRIDLDTPCHDVPGKSGTWRKLLGKEACAAAVLAYDETGALHHLLDKKAAAKALREKHGLKEATANNTGKTAYDRENAKRRAQAKLGKAAALAANARVAHLMTECATPEHIGVNGLLAVRLRTLVQGVVSVTWSDACRRVAGRRELPGEDHREAVLAHANMLDDPGALLGLAAELVAAKLSLDWSSEWYGGERDSEKPFWQGWDISRAKLVKEAEGEAKEKKASKAKKAAKAHANGRPPVTRDTFLIDLVPGQDVSRIGRALEGAGVPTVGLLLAAIGRPAKQGASYTSHAYEHLRGIKGLLLGQAHEIADALVDAGLITADGPGEPAEPERSVPSAGVCRLCSCTEANCARCVERTGEACHWVDDARTLCSACEQLAKQGLGLLGGIPTKMQQRLSKAGYHQVGDVAGKRPEDLAGVKAGDALQVTAEVEKWLRDRLGRLVDGTELMPEEPSCTVCTAHGEVCAEEHVERAASNLDDTDVDTLLPLTSLPEPLQAIFRREHGLRPEQLVCVSCCVRWRDAQASERKRRAKEGAQP